MMSNKLTQNAKTFFSNRSNRNTLLTVTILGFCLGYFSGNSESIVIPEKVQIIQEAVLEGLVIQKEPTLDSHREEILNDYSNRISDEFSIPAGMRDRVGFWFDIYSKYDSNKKVIHHTRYPWIVFKVVDVSEIINSDTPKIRWLRNVKADKFVTSELEKIKQALKEISKTGIVDPQNEQHQLVANTLSKLQGSLKENAKEAFNSIRVQTGQKNFFQDGIETSHLYLNGMEDVFAKYKLPKELTRLPFVESSFNRHAVSKVGAAGIWQFMDYTGKSFMTISKHIDERKSPFKSTEAAARLLKENHMILHKSWPLAITAWNHGPAGVRRAIKAANSKEISDIVNNYQSRTFDFASSNFYAEFLAALYTEKYQDHIFENLDHEKALELHSVKLARSISAKELLRRSGIEKDDFLLFNPDLKKALEVNASIPSGFTVMVDTPARVVLRALLTPQSRDSRITKLSQNERSLQDIEASIKN